MNIESIEKIVNLEINNLRESSNFEDKNLEYIGDFLSRFSREKREDGTVLIDYEAVFCIAYYMVDKSKDISEIKEEIYSNINFSSSADIISGNKPEKKVIKGDKNVNLDALKVAIEALSDLINLESKFKLTNESYINVLKKHKGKPGSGKAQKYVQKNGLRVINRDYYNNSSFKEMMDSISRYHINKKQIRAKEIKNIKSEICLIEEAFKSILYEINLPEIVSAVDKIMKIQNENLKKVLLEYIYTHNKKNYDLVYMEYNKLSNNKALKIQTILRNNSINISISEIENNIDLTLSELEYILSLFSSYNSIKPSVRKKALLIGSFNSISTIISLVKEGIISCNYINNNPDIFDKSSSKYTNILTIIEAFKKYTVNPLYIYGNEYLLNYESNTIINNLNILSDYFLIQSLSSDTCYKFFNDINLEEKIDLLLELGYENFLESNIDILAYDISKLKRLIIMKNIGIILLSFDEIEEVLESNNFFIEDSEIDKYTCSYVLKKLNDSISNLPLPLDIEKYSLEAFNTKRTYKIQNIYISKNRFNRNMNKLKIIDCPYEEKIVNSLLALSYLTYEEYNILNDNNLFKKNKVY